MTTDPARPVVIVTGGSRGIGRQIVQDLAGKGQSVVFTHTASAHDAGEVERACGTVALVRGVRLDITDSDAPERLFDIAAAIGTPVALVNNAGVTGPLGPLEDLSDEQLRRVVDVNLIATVRLCREAGRRWGRRANNERRHIINVSSIAARTGSPNEYVVYAATKAAVDALTIGLAKELGPAGIRINAVRAGTTNTMIHALAGDPGRPHRIAQSVPLGRVAEPAEIAAAVTWLLSAESSYISGALLDITGGA